MLQYAIEGSIVLARPASSEGMALADASEWIVRLVQGPIALSIATIAIATVGFLMLQGRLPLKRGTVAVLGCSIILGAPTIARGLMGVTGSDQQPIEPTLVDTVPTPPMRSPPPSRVRVDADPYAGAF